MLESSTYAYSWLLNHNLVCQQVEHMFISDFGIIKLKICEFIIKKSRIYMSESWKYVYFKLRNHKSKSWKYVDSEMRNHRLTC